jgi:hypothetical protein
MRNRRNGNVEEQVLHIEAVEFLSLSFGQTHRAYIVGQANDLRIGLSAVTAHLPRGKDVSAKNASTDRPVKGRAG